MGQSDRLRAVDALWLDAERPGPSLAIGSIDEVEGPAPSIEEFREFIASRLDRMPRLQERLNTTRFGVTRPTWEHTTADLTEHVRELAVQAPGDQAAVEAAIGQVMETPMDLSIPLWDAHLITGLPEGRFVVVTRMHHAVADGQGSVITLGHLVDLDPQGTTSLADAYAGAAPPVDDDPGGSKRALLMDAAAKGGDLTLRALRMSVKPAEAAQSAVGSVEDLSRRATDQVSASATGMRALASPRSESLLGGDPGQRRYWRTHQVAMADVKRVRQAFGATVNDVVMTLVSGGYATMMERRGQDPTDQLLRVLIPVSVRAPGDMATNNQVTSLFVQLPVSGPATERMEWIRTHINKVKDSKTPETMKLIADMLNVAPAMVQTVAVRLNGPFPAGALDTLVTNVPGPFFPIYIMGRRIRRLMPMVALGRPLWCSIAVVSYDGQLNFGISTGDGGEQAGIDIREGIERTLADLLAGAEPDPRTEHA